MNKPSKPTVLAVLDGWGLSDQKEGNAVFLSKTSFLDRVKSNYPTTRIQTCCQHVGLPIGVMGNSEVGHLNMGAGRVVKQDVVTINEAIETGTFYSNPTLLSALEHVRRHNSKIHLVGMISDGLVHSNIEILFSLLKMCKEQNIDQVYIHVITDGIDVNRRSALKYLEQVENKIKEFGVGKIVTIGGRHYAMDRAHNYDRTARAYHAMVHGIGPYEKSAEAAVKRAYRYDLNDDMIEPTIISDSYTPKALVGDGDGFVFFNLRSDRTRQLSKPFVLDDFDFFDRGPQLQDLYFVGMTNFGDDLPMSIAFLETKLVNTLPEYLGKHKKINQLYIAEEEKFSHVAYFFHGGSSVQYPKEKRIMVPSLHSKSHDEKPEMSAEQVTDEIINYIKSEPADFVMVNYANPDIIGHTGNLKAAIKALEFVDEQVKRLAKVVLGKDGNLVVTADHGNCEEMLSPKNEEVLRRHTTNPVSFSVVSNNKNLKNIKLEEGALCNVSPTVLKMMSFDVPSEMDASALF